jgi:hypothetical protein
VSTDTVNFIRQLAKLLRGGTDDPGAGRTLWLYAAIEGETGAAPAYTVLAPYPGAARAYAAPLAEASFQLMTTGAPRDPEGAMAQAQEFYDRLCDDDGRPLRDVALQSFRLVGVTSLRGPGVVDRDERERTLIATNFDVKFHAA